MRTSSFHLYTGPGRIAISRSVPLHTPKGYRVARWLAPPREWHHLPRVEFATKYVSMLEVIGAATIWDQLHALAGGAEPHLLCWERLHRRAEWCHRRMVAEFIERELAVVVPEVGQRPVQETLDFG